MAAEHVDSIFVHPAGHFADPVVPPDLVVGNFAEVVEHVADWAVHLADSVDHLAGPVVLLVCLADLFVLTAVLVGRLDASDFDYFVVPLDYAVSTVVQVVDPVAPVDLADRVEPNVDVAVEVVARVAASFLGGYFVPVAHLAVPADLAEQVVGTSAEVANRSADPVVQAGVYAVPMAQKKRRLYKVL